jgi:adenosylmethionine-8-amino-7-oxononanoate aminotransferase
VFVEPVQNAGGCFPPPPGYFDRLREICDQYDVLLVSDEVICAYGRLGTMFGADKFSYVPDIITSAKGLTSGYSPLGATIVSDRVYEPFGRDGVVFAHGYTFGGHPVSCAVALANLDLFAREDLLGNVLGHENALRQSLEDLRDIPIVGDVRGDGYFWALELVKDQASKERFTPAEGTALLKGYVAGELWDRGLYCRTDDRGEPVIQVAPPLICGQAEFDEMAGILREVLTEAAQRI